MAKQDLADALISQWVGDTPQEPPGPGPAPSGPAGVQWAGASPTDAQHPAEGRVGGRAGLADLQRDASASDLADNLIKQYGTDQPEGVEQAEGALANALRRSVLDQRQAQRRREELQEAGRAFGPPGVRDAALAIGGAGADLLSLPARLVGAGDRIVELGEGVEQVAEAANADLPDSARYLLRMGRGAGRSLSTMAVAPTPAGMISLASAIEGNQALTESRRAGQDAATSAANVAAAATIEAGLASILQRIGLGGTETMLAARRGFADGVGRGLRQLGKDTLRRLPEELILEEIPTEVLHQVRRKVAGLDPQALTPDKLLETVRDTAVQTTMQMGLASTSRGAIDAGRAVRARQAEPPVAAAPLAPEAGVAPLPTAPEQAETGAAPPPPMPAAMPDEAPAPPAGVPPAPAPQEAPGPRQAEETARQLSRLPRPRNVSAAEWNAALEDARGALRAAPEAGQADAQPFGKGVVLDFGEGGQTAVLLASPEEFGRLAKDNAQNAWASYQRANPGTRVTRRAFMSEYIGNAQEAAVILDPEGDAVPVGVNAVVYLNTRGFRPGAVTEELAHKAFMRHVSLEDLGALREFLQSKGVRVPDVRPEALRNDADFQEAVVNQVYKPYVEGAFEPTPQAQTTLGRIFDGVRRFFARITGTESFGDRLARKPDALVDRIRPVLERVRSGAALATAPQDVSPQDPGPLQERADIARTQARRRAREKQGDRSVEQRDRRQDIADVAIGNRATAEELRARKLTDAEQARRQRAEQAATRARQAEDRAAATDLTTDLRTDRMAQQEAMQQQRGRAGEKRAQAAEMAAETARQREERRQAEEGLREDLATDRMAQAERRLRQQEDQDAAKELRQLSRSLLDVRKADITVETEEAVAALIEEATFVGELIAEADNPADKAAFRDEVARLRRQARALRSERRVQQARATADARRNATFASRNVTSLRSENPVAEAMFADIRTGLREDFATVEQEMRKASLELRVLGRKRVRDKLRPRFAPAGRSNRYDGILLHTLKQDVDNEVQRLAERGNALAPQFRTMLDEVANMYATMASRRGIELNDLDRMKEQTPWVQYENTLKRVIAPTRRQERRIAKLPPEQQQARRQEIAQANIARFEATLRKIGIDPAEVMRPEHTNNALFSSNLALAGEVARLGPAKRAAVLGVWLTRAPLFGPGSAARITLAGLAGFGPILVGKNVGAAANVLTAGQLRRFGVNLPGSEILKADASLFAGVFKGAYGAAMTVIKQESYIISQVRGRRVSLAEEHGTRGPTDAELLAPGNSARARAARYALNTPFSLLGAADQVAQGVLSGVVEQTVPHARARELGLRKGSEAYRSFIRKQQTPATRDPEVQEAMEAELLDLAAARPFSGEGFTSKTLANYENMLRNASPLTRLALVQLTPVFRGAIRGGELAGRMAPLTSVVFLARDMRRAGDTNATLAERQRALNQALNATVAHTLPFLLAAALDPDDLDKMAEGELGDISIKYLPFVGVVYQAYGAMARAVQDQDADAYNKATATISTEMLKELFPMRRLVGETLAWGDKDWANYARQTPMGARIDDFLEKQAVPEEQRDSVIKDMLETLAPVRDVLLLTDDAFVRQHNWPHTREMPTRIPLGEAGFSAMVGLRTTEPITTFRVPQRGGKDALVGERAREYQMAAQRYYNEMRGDRDEDDLTDDEHRRLRARARRRARTEFRVPR